MRTSHGDVTGPLPRQGGVGIPLLLLSAIVLLLAGLFAVAWGLSGRFLPHEEQFLGMTAGELCALHGCRVVHFMAHDRVSFGGALIALGLLYLWLAASPLRRGEEWAWWVFLLTGVLGFGSFLAYLGYGYLDRPHGVATLGLLPCFAFGLARSWGLLVRTPNARCLLAPSVRWPWRSAAGLGRACLLASAAGTALGGLVILIVGTTCVFVPQDLEYMGVGVGELNALNPRLVPLIAHDRAGFGGAVCCCGLALFFCVWCGTPSRALWGVLGTAGAAGFGTAIGVHPAVGYNDAIHLAPAVLGALFFLAGMILTFRPTAADIRSPRPAEECPRAASTELPPLRELGPDLLRVNPWRRLLSLGLPFVWCGAYFAFAAVGWWAVAVFALVALSFVTYGSTSHDLVHRNLGLSRATNDVLLCLIELLALRSGHAYQAAHLHHHARYPHSDDVEATAAGRSWLEALAEGLVFQFRVWLWAVRNAGPVRKWVVGEAIACVSLAAVAVAFSPITSVPLVYVALMVMGAWVIPLVTSYVPHDPHAEGELFQTQAFRGVVASAVGLGHLYHLEHHLYPSVPHHNWPRLARRLDPYLARAGVRPVRFWF
jgi:beta-carotene hydroxylase